MSGASLYAQIRIYLSFFSLETQAAGLSWLTVLKKRDGYKEAFENFDIKKVASFDKEKEKAILQYDVIKYPKKIAAIIHNAKEFLKIIDEFGSLDKFFWSYVNFTPIKNEILNYKTAPTTSKISDTLTKDLKQRGFKFIGSVTIYAFMQASGMINDHEISCDFIN